MDRAPFIAAVGRVRAEQFFQEKAASASAVSAVQLANIARAGDAADLELLKLAHTYCPEAPLEYYEKLGGKFDFKDPARKATGLLRTGEKLLGTRAKRLQTAIGGLDHDILMAKGTMESARKAHVQAPSAGHGEKLKEMTKSLDALKDKRKGLHGELHGVSKRISVQRPASGGGTGAVDVNRHTPGERHAVSETRGKALGGAAAAGVGGLYLKGALDHYGKLQSKQKKR